MSRIENYLVSLREFFPKETGTPIDMRREEHCARAVLAHMLAEERVGGLTRDLQTRNYLDLLNKYRAPLADHLQGNALLRSKLDATLANASLAVHAEVDALMTALLRSASKDSSKELAAFLAEAVRVECASYTAIESAYLKAVEGNDFDANETSAKPIKRTDFDAAGIGRLLRMQFPDETELAVSGLEPVFGGYSKNTTICTLAGNKNLPSKLVIRSDSELALSGGSVVEEFPLLSRLYDAGVKVPQPLLVARETGKAPLMIVKWIPGKSFGTLFGSFKRSESLCREVAGQLAQIHTLPVSELQFLKGYDTEVSEQIGKELGAIKADWRALNYDDLIVEYAIQWLTDNIDRSHELRGLVHGDYGPNNFLADDDNQLHAILDWESARVANPVEDVAYCRIMAETLWSWNTFMEAYVAAGAPAPSKQSLNYYSIYCILILVVKVSQLKAACDSSPKTSVRTVVPVVNYRRRSLILLQEYLAQA